MEACTLPGTVKLPEYMNEGKFSGCNWNPVVVLTDCRKALKNTPPPSPKRENHEKQSEADSEEAVRARIRTEVSLTTPGSSPSQLNAGKFKSLKRKRNSCDVEYEIEKILGYHRSKKGMMLYLIKWKGWADEHNTFEPIDNLTGCHYELMRYFEVRRPTNANLRAKDQEITESATNTELYGKLRRNKCTREDIEKFLCDIPRGLTEIFDTKDLNRLEKQVEEEYEYIVRCLIGMGRHPDPGLVLRGRNYKLLLILIQQRLNQLANLSAVEQLINDREETEIRIVNDVDLEEFPELKYIVEMKRGNGIFFPEEPLLGCECQRCNPRSRCCGRMSDSIFAYCPDGKLRISHRVAIYECNSRCHCPPTCPNRVVQRGRQVKLCIFKTKSCGWGVKAVDDIPRGAFVCEYVGELIPDSEANVRDLNYLGQGRSGYMFDLDFFIDSSVDMYCIDATEYGNVARFINHSCDPNLVVYPVWVDCLAPNMHRLAFFARRRIREGEEIHFDYENLEQSSEEEVDDSGKTYSLRMMANVRCQCNSSNCRNWVFGTK